MVKLCMHIDSLDSRGSMYSWPIPWHTVVTYHATIPELSRPNGTGTPQTLPMYTLQVLQPDCLWPDLPVHLRSKPALARSGPVLGFCSKDAIKGPFLSKAVEVRQPKDDSQTKCHKDEYEPLHKQHQFDRSISS